MNTATLRALNAVGSAPIRLRVNPEVYPHHQGKSVALDRLTYQDGQIEVSDSPHAWLALRDFCKLLIETRNRSL